MTQRRCFLPDPCLPGSLQLLSISLASHCAPFQRTCLIGALRKWLELFTIQIIEHTLCEMGVLLLAYIPNVLLNEEQAQARTSNFDQKQLDTKKGLWKPKKHNYSPDKLNSLPLFMQVFVRDFLQSHRSLPIPRDLPEGMAPYPRQQGRYKARTVCYNALPPVFSGDQIKSIRRKLKALGFPGQAKAWGLPKLCMSPHGIGPKGFLQSLEDRCFKYLQETSDNTIPYPRCPGKIIVPFSPDAWERRLGELAKMQPYEHYPKTWLLLEDIGTTKASLLRPESFRQTSMDAHMALNTFVLAYLPLTLTLMLADGTIRWYYKATKDVDFPYYNHYRELKHYELPLRLDKEHLKKYDL